MTSLTCIGTIYTYIITKQNFLWSIYTCPACTLQYYLGNPFCWHWVNQVILPSAMEVTLNDMDENRHYQTTRKWRPNISRLAPCCELGHALAWLQCHLPDSKAHGAHMEPTWVLLAPDGPHVGPMNLDIRAGNQSALPARLALSDG